SPTYGGRGLSHGTDLPALATVGTRSEPRRTALQSAVLPIRSVTSLHCSARWMDAPARARQCRYTMQIPGWPYAHGLPQSACDNRLVAAIGYMSHAKSKRDVSGVAPTSTIGCV